MFLFKTLKKFYLVIREHFLMNIWKNTISKDKKISLNMLQSLVLLILATIFLEMY